MKQCTVISSVWEVERDRLLCTLLLEATTANEQEFAGSLMVPHWIAPCFVHRIFYAVMQCHQLVSEAKLFLHNERLLKMSSMFD